MPTAENYRNTQVMTASPMELILMLYDECIRALNKAEHAFNIEGPVYLQEVNNNLLHAQDIITELSVSLDMEKGGEIAVNLQRLYEFMVSHLIDANVTKNVKPVVEVLDLMRELRDTWQKVADQEPAGQHTESGAVDTGLLAAG